MKVYRDTSLYVLENLQAFTGSSQTPHRASQLLQKALLVYLEKTASLTLRYPKLRVPNRFSPSPVLLVSTMPIGIHPGSPSWDVCD